MAHVGLEIVLHVRRGLVLVPVGHVGLLVREKVLFVGRYPPTPGVAPPWEIRTFGNPYQQVYMADELKMRKHRSKSHNW